MIQQNPYKNSSVEWIRESKDMSRSMLIVDAYKQIGIPYSDAELLALFNHMQYDNHLLKIAAKMISFPLLYVIYAIPYGINEFNINASNYFIEMTIAYFLFISYLEVIVALLLYIYLLSNNIFYCYRAGGLGILPQLRQW